jgi:sugar/nucleoside kinase (ribokinase family)
MDLFSIGEMVIDFIPGAEPGSYIRNAGGAPANVAIAAARNGLSSGFCGKMGNDDFGKFLVKTLRENNVQILCKELTDRAITTMAFVTLNENGERSFTFARKPGADMLLEKSDIPLGILENSAIVHAGSCSLSSEPIAGSTIFALKQGHERGKLISFDVNYRESMWDTIQTAADKITEILPYVDLLKISEEEIAILGGENNILKVMRDNRIAAVVETLGPRGSRCFWNSAVLTSSPWGGKAVDTTGAGDAFWGGFLSKLRFEGITEPDQLNAAVITEAMRYGNISGGLCVQKKGAINALPRRNDIETIYSKDRTETA